MGVTERRQRERQERRVRIMEAAERIFLSKGLAAATMDEIAQAAEVSKGTLYLYFKNKDDLHIASALRGLEELSKLFEEAYARGGTGFERVARLMKAHARFAAEHAQRFRVSVSWLSSDYVVDAGLPSFVQYRRVIADVFRIGGEAIELGKRDGTIRRDLDTAELAMLLWGGLLGILLLRTRDEELARRLPLQADWTRMPVRFTELILRGIRPEEVDATADPRSAVEHG